MKKKHSRLSSAWFQLEASRGNMCDFRAGGLDDVWAHRPLPLTTTKAVSAVFLLRFTNIQHKYCLGLTKNSIKYGSRGKIMILCRYVMNMDGLGLMIFCTLCAYNIYISVSVSL